MSSTVISKPQAADVVYGSSAANRRSHSLDRSIVLHRSSRSYSGSGSVDGDTNAGPRGASGPVRPTALPCSNRLLRILRSSGGTEDTAKRLGDGVQRGRRHISHFASHHVLVDWLSAGDDGAHRVEQGKRACTRYTRAESVCRVAPEKSRLDLNRIGRPRGQSQWAANEPVNHDMNR